MAEPKWNAMTFSFIVEFIILFKKYCKMQTVYCSVFTFIFFFGVTGWCGWGVGGGGDLSNQFHCQNGKCKFSIRLRSSLLFESTSEFRIQTITTSISELDIKEDPPNSQFPNHLLLSFDYCRLVSTVHIYSMLMQFFARSIVSMLLQFAAFLAANERRKKWSKKIPHPKDFHIHFE